MCTFLLHTYNDNDIIHGVKYENTGDKIAMLISSNHNGGHFTNLVLKDQNNDIIVVFEDKSTVMGNKISVFDGNGKEIYFLDQDMSQVDDTFSIQKGDDTVASTTREDALVQRIIKINAKDAQYNYNVRQRLLEKDGEKIAKLSINNRDQSFQIELLIEDDLEFVVVLLYTIFVLLSEF